MIVQVNGVARDVADGLTVAELVAELTDADAARGIAVAVDGAVVPRADRGRVRLAADAKVEIVTAVQGG